jgi:hypothetical protein
MKRSDLIRQLVAAAFYIGTARSMIFISIQPTGKNSRFRVIRRSMTIWRGISRDTWE